MIKFTVDDLGDLAWFLDKFTGFLRGEMVDEDAVFDSRLVSCELISNVLKHGGVTAHFCGEIVDGDIVISVHGENDFGAIPAPTLPSAFAESGRGLYIINAVSGGNVRVDGKDVVVTLRRR